MKLEQLFQEEQESVIRPQDDGELTYDQVWKSQPKITSESFSDPKTVKKLVAQGQILGNTLLYSYPNRKYVVIVLPFPRTAVPSIHIIVPEFNPILATYHFDSEFGLHQPLRFIISEHESRMLDIEMAKYSRQERRKEILEKIMRPFRRFSSKKK